MTAISDYSSNCDYLVERYDLSNPSIYTIIEMVVNELKELDFKKEEQEFLIEQTTVGEEQPVIEVVEAEPKKKAVKKSTKGKKK